MIESEYINPLTVKLDKVEEMQSRMRGLASAVKNLQEYDEWNDKTRIPRGLTAAQSATGTQIGHIDRKAHV